ncbi:Zinc finger protein [Fusarium oxysporum f. sp. cubense]|uniref:Zinc finger protein n=1 Tax=Fusarium oxysporum f. sp. cubense TaxID=61366 RepID=A0A559KZM1_FUSOC|nr:Zinc finger protein [Fusarium oxysporum f. sp. cubense]
MVLAESPDAEPRGDASPVAASRVFNCTQCKSKFNRQAHLKRHQKSHRADKPFSCLYCKLSSSRKDVITRHTRNFHPDKMRTPSNGNSRSRSSLSPRRAASIQAQSDLDGTASDKEPRRMSTLGTSLSQDSDVTSAVYESFGDSISRENRLLGLDAPTVTSTDMLDIWGDFQFADPAMSQLIGPDVLLLPDMAPQSHQGIRFPPLQALPSPISSTSIASCPPESRGAFYIEDEQYQRAKQNYDAVTTSERFSSYRFPSKFAVSRFVRGFFEYMAPHMPIVHLPTFNIISTPAPLLIEIMACGALYAKEPTAAQSLHVAALLLMRKLAHEAIRELEVPETPTYKEWVHHETLNRCLSAIVILSAALFLDSPERCSLLTIQHTRFPLPSSASLWSKDEGCWKRPNETFYSTDTVKLVLDGYELPPQNSDFGFATIVSAVVCHICAFESLFGAQHPDLFNTFIEKMDGPVQALKNAWKEQSSTQFLIESSVSHMAHTTRSMILSTSFHLYGSQQLRTMKESLRSPALFDWASLETSSDICLTARLEKALIMAAEMLRSDCQTGLGYIKSVGLHKFAPLAFIAPYEGTLLLCWYLQSKKSGRSLHPVVDKLISDAISEADGWVDLHHESLEVFPLELYAKLFDSSLWHCLYDVCQRLTRLKQQLIVASSNTADFECIVASGLG